MPTLNKDESSSDSRRMKRKPAVSYVDKRSRYKQYNTKDLKTAARAYIDGRHNCMQSADKYGVPRSTLFHYLRKIGFIKTTNRRGSKSLRMKTKFMNKLATTPPISPLASDCDDFVTDEAGMRVRELNDDITIDVLKPYEDSCLGLKQDSDNAATKPDVSTEAVKNEMNDSGISTNEDDSFINVNAIKSEPINIDAEVKKAQVNFKNEEQDSFESKLLETDTIVKFVYSEGPANMKVHLKENLIRAILAFRFNDMSLEAAANIFGIQAKLIHNFLRKLGYFRGKTADNKGQYISHYSNKISGNGKCSCNCCVPCIVFKHCFD